MAKLERVYNVPLRKEWLKVPKYQRAAKAMRGLRAFLVRHMKSDNVIIGPFVNMEVWTHGMKNPPHHVKVNAVKEDDGTVTVELFGKPLPQRKDAKPAEKGAVKKAVEALTGLTVKDKKPEQEKPAIPSPALQALPSPETAKEPPFEEKLKEPKKSLEKKEKKAKIIKK